MPTSCPLARQWLRLTFYQWTQRSPLRAPQRHHQRLAARHVSTTSAINRGLRAETENQEQSHRRISGDELSRLRYHGSDRGQLKSRGRKEDTGVTRRERLVVRKHRSFGKSYAQQLGDPFSGEKVSTQSGFEGAQRFRRKVTRYDENDDAQSQHRASRQAIATRHRKRQGTSGIDPTSTNRGVTVDERAGGRRERVEVSSHDIHIQTTPLRMREQAAAMYTQIRGADKDVAAQGESSTLQAHQNDKPSSVSETERDDKKKEYEDLFNLLRTLQLAEATPTPIGVAMGDMAKSKLGKLINTLNTNTMRMSETKRMLADVLGPCMTIAAVNEEQNSLISWSKSYRRPSMMPKSIIWYNLKTGNLELVLADPDTLRRATPVGRDAKELQEAIVTKTTPLNQRPREPILDVRAILRSCMTHLRRLQDASGSTSPTYIETSVARLRKSVETLNEDFLGAGIVQATDVLSELRSVMGRPGMLWTKLQHTSSRTMLRFDTDAQRFELVRREPVVAPRVSEVPRWSNQPKAASVEREAMGNDAAVQEIHRLLRRCGKFLEAVQYDERKTYFSRRDSASLTIQKKNARNLVIKANHYLEEARLENETLYGLMEKELGKAGELWTTRRPQGNKTVLWLHEDRDWIEMVEKETTASAQDRENVLNYSDHSSERNTTSSRLPPVHNPEQPASEMKHQDGRYRPMQDHDARADDQGSRPDRGPGSDEVEDWMRNQNGSSESIHASRGSMGRPTANADQDDMPISIPYTTAASTFVYGANAVLAALSSKKRRFYHLYLNKSEDSDKKNFDQIQKLAKEAEIPTTTNANTALLNKMSNSRPHNGVVLEASYLPAPPVLGLGKPDQRLSVMPVQLYRQSAEDVVVNGTPTALPTLTNSWRHPFVLMLDGVLDEGNMGNIMRTAYFYGVDAVAVSKNTCASVNSSVVAKASSGAIEAVQILSLPYPAKFVYSSLRASWRVFAAVAPPGFGQIPSKDTKKYITHSSVAASSPLRDYPCILMLGAEGEGLRDNLKHRADFFVSIEQGERAGVFGGVLPGIGVDSMNVSSAAGVLVESFMRKPQGAQPLGRETDLGF